MLVVHHPNQALHDPDTVFRTGQFIPQPDRAERYRIFLDVARHEGYSIAEAPLGSLAPILDVHDAGYVEFLKTAHHRWSAQPDYGPVAIPNVHPTHRMRRERPDSNSRGGEARRAPANLCNVSAAWPSCLSRSDGRCVLSQQRCDSDQSPS
jgi:acetoin utilization deacetylase AcuC-like enzyme